jgi:hypothetical protein
MRLPVQHSLLSVPFLKRCFHVFPAIVFLFVLIGCGPKPFIHPDYAKMKPKVIVVLPPENTTTNDNVESVAYPILFEKLSNRGYYCISPELVRAVFNANRLEDAGRINALPPQKMKEVFNADAVFRTKILDWSSKYVILSSTVTITLDMEMLDATTGEKLWAFKSTVSKAPGDGGGSLLGALISAAVNAAFTQYEPIMEENAKNSITLVPLGDYGKANSNK